METETKTTLDCKFLENIIKGCSSFPLKTDSETAKMNIVRLNYLIPGSSDEKFHKENSSPSGTKMTRSRSFETFSHFEAKILFMMISTVI